MSPDGTAAVAESEAIKSENPCGNRGYDALRRSLSPDGKTGEEWRRRESNLPVKTRQKQRFPKKAVRNPVQFPAEAVQKAVQ